MKFPSESFHFGMAGLPYEKRWDIYSRNKSYTTKMLDTMKEHGIGWVYEIGTNRPVFCGRDGVVKYSIWEIDPAFRARYAWYGKWGDLVIGEKTGRDR